MPQIALLLLVTSGEVPNPGNNYIQLASNKYRSLENPYVCMHTSIRSSSNHDTRPSAVSLHDVTRNTIVYRRQHEPPFSTKLSEPRTGIRIWSEMDKARRTELEARPNHRAVFSGC
jgi:hypothetical protein